MRTEEQIAYEILNIVYGGKVSNDDTVSERLVRSFMRKHRASKFGKYYSKGMDVDDFLFQEIGELEFEINKHGDYTAEIPAIINFPLNQGLRVKKDSYQIPVVDKNAFDLSKKNIINKSSPKATLLGSRLIIYVGYNDPCNFFDFSEKEKAVNSLIKEAGELDNISNINAKVEAVLYDPDDGLNYNWTISPYPCPSDIIDQLTTSTLARDFELLIRNTSDQVPNSKSDNVNFSDTLGVKN